MVASEASMEASEVGLPWMRPCQTDRGRRQNTKSETAACKISAD